MKKVYLYSSFIILVVFIAGCAGLDKETILENARQKLSSFETYSCNLYQKCPELEGTTCEKNFLTGEIVVDKPKDKMLISLEEVQRDDIDDTKLIVNRVRIDIFDGEKREMLRSRIYTDSILKTYDRYILGEDFTNPIKDEDVIELASKLIDFIRGDPDSFSIKIDSFTIIPTGETVRAVIISEKRAQDEMVILAFNEDTIVPVYFGADQTYVSNCKIDTELSTEFEFPESYKLGFVYNHVETCNQDSDCDDGNPDTGDRCENIFRPPICSHFYG